MMTAHYYTYFQHNSMFRIVFLMYCVQNYENIQTNVNAETVKMVKVHFHYYSPIFFVLLLCNRVQQSERKCHQMSKYSQIPKMQFSSLSFENRYLKQNY
jgi:hypothetical protein